MTASPRRESPFAPPLVALLAVPLLAAVLLAGCGPSKTVFPRSADQRGGGTYEPRESLFGEGGMTLLGNDSIFEGDGAAGGAGIGVNSFLWRASLDTISFMPLVSADPFGGVIITDWHTPPEAERERFKINVYILGRDLRADGIRAAVFRQLDNGQGQWIDAKVDAQTAVDLENAILTRARQLRVAGFE